MTMRVAILGEPAGWHVSRLVAALQARGQEATVVRWHELTAVVAGATVPAEQFLPPAIDQADIVVVRGMPQGGLEDVIFRMDLLGRLAARGQAIINSPRALELAIDKYLSLAKLADGGVAVPHTIVAQNPAAIQQAWQSLGCDAVIKPLFGSCGRGIQRLSTRESLEPYIEAATARGNVAYLQEFVPHAGWDVRILLVGKRAFSMRRVSARDWRTNVARGGRPEPFSPPQSWIDLARRSATLLETEIAGVDLLPANDGRLLVIEINAVPGWRGLERATGTDIAAAVAEHLKRSFNPEKPVF
ncbi:MAG: RimK family alpha-L-glutamate ligase [Planctomycetota bacterium]